MSRKLGRCSKYSLGYTLLEILLVLAILAGAGFFLSLKIPANLQERGIELSSTQLLQDLRETQQAALAGNVWYRIKFFPATNEYMIFKQGEFIRAVSLSPGVNLADSPSELTLLPTGAPASGMSVILQAGNLQRRVIIAPVMGRTRVEIVR
ncbi:MAG: prepilin-type N-terminal cleavage/methylation domain-containing protein [Desulfitobacteriia bacterium]|jgi:prepilin-type N-terminal cleavage/methylation domain-containing protein